MPVFKDHQKTHPKSQSAYQHDRRNIIFKEQQNGLRLRITEAYVVLQDLWARLSEDEAREEQADEGISYREGLNVSLFEIKLKD